MTGRHRWSDVTGEIAQDLNYRISRVGRYATAHSDGPGIIRIIPEDIPPSGYVGCLEWYLDIRGIEGRVTADDHAAWIRIDRNEIESRGGW